jgi:hypothetical protein
MSSIEQNIDKSGIKILPPPFVSNKNKKQHVVGYPDDNILNQIQNYTKRTKLSESSLVVRLLEAHFRRFPE